MIDYCNESSSPTSKQIPSINGDNPTDSSEVEYNPIESDLAKYNLDCYKFISIIYNGDCG